MRKHWFWVSRDKAFHYCSLHFSKQVLEPAFCHFLSTSAHLATPFGDPWLHFWGSLFQVAKKSKEFFPSRAGWRLSATPPGEGGNRESSRRRLGDIQESSGGKGGLTVIWEELDPTSKECQWKTIELQRHRRCRICDDLGSVFRSLLSWKNTRKNRFCKNPSKYNRKKERGNTVLHFRLNGKREQNAQHFLLFRSRQSVTQFRQST